jgi:hypothetical protein
MFLSFAYLAFSSLLRLLVARWRSAALMEVELLVLRHSWRCCAARSGSRRCVPPTGEGRGNLLVCQPQSLADGSSASASAAARKR